MPRPYSHLVKGSAKKTGSSPSREAHAECMWRLLPDPIQQNMGHRLCLGNKAVSPTRSLEISTRKKFTASICTACVPSGHPTHRRVLQQGDCVSNEMSMRHLPWQQCSEPIISSGCKCWQTNR